MEKTRLTLITLLLTITAFSFACLRQLEPTETAEPEVAATSPDLGSRFVALEGDVQYRRSDGAWSRASTDDKLRPGDWVKTAGAGHAEIRFPDGSTYVLRPDTLVHLDGLLDRRPDSGWQFEPDFARIGLHSDLPAGPRLVSPMGEQRIDFATQKVLRLAWEEVPDAPRYALHVSRSLDFDSNVIEDPDRRQPSASLGIRGEGTFYWRVAAYEPGGSLGPWSETRSFQIAARS